MTLYLKKHSGWWFLSNNKSYVSSDSSMYFNRVTKSLSANCADGWCKSRSLLEDEARSAGYVVCADEAFEESKSQQWPPMQSVESAPKDGRYILVACNFAGFNEPVVDKCRYSNGFWVRSNGVVWAEAEQAVGWWYLPKV